jgi:hypothetical protein
MAAWNAVRGSRAQCAAAASGTAKSTVPRHEGINHLVIISGHVFAKEELRGEDAQGLAVVPDHLLGDHRVSRGKRGFAHLDAELRKGRATPGVALHESKAMASYEILTMKAGRWVAAGVFTKKDAAIDAARGMVTRHLASEVRVVAVEEDASGFKEQTVFKRSAMKVNPSGAAAPERAVRKHKPVLGPRSWTRRERLLAAAVAAAAIGMIGYGLTMPKGEWAFDLPDAKKPHQLHNPFTGEFSR